MPTLEQLLKQAAKAARKPTRSKAAALWPMPGNPDLAPDAIQDMDFGEAKSLVERIQATYDRRNAALWDHLSLSEPGPLPWAACLPMIYDPGHLLGEHDGDWLDPHWGYDYYPGPLGLQHRVNISSHRFVSHGIAASMLPPAPDAACRL